MQMLLERAAGFFQAEGWHVKVGPSVLGDSGAIHSPDLQLVREGERACAVFVFEELDGHGPLDQRAFMAKDMGCAPVFIVGSPSPEVVAYAERHRWQLLTAPDLGESLPQASPPPAEEGFDSDADIRAVSPRPPQHAPMQPPAHAPLPTPLHIAPPPPAPEPDESGAMLLPGNPRDTAPPPRAPRVGRGVIPVMPVGPPPDDGDAMLLPSKPSPPPPRAAAAHTPAPSPMSTAPAPLPTSHGEETGAELLSSGPRLTRDADKLLKHDPSIWDPRARLAQVRRAAKANGFETTGVQESTSSPWLTGLKKRP
jgi:hypothetical protein